VSKLIKRLCKAISSYIVSVNVLEANIAFPNTILNIVVVYINVLRTFVIAFSANKLDRRLIIAVELN
jgi:hypothetical protein